MLRGFLKVGRAGQAKWATRVTMRRPPEGEEQAQVQAADSCGPKSGGGLWAAADA